MMRTFSSEVLLEIIAFFAFLNNVKNGLKQAHKLVVIPDYSGWRSRVSKDDKTSPCCLCKGLISYGLPPEILQLIPGMRFRV
uniref:Uncharacterized protein n=1 Tax=Ditylenchus dipsaci TaxID=166011 RepID=A0A915EHQ7_9BILA